MVITIAKNVDLSSCFVIIRDCNEISEDFSEENCTVFQPRHQCATFYAQEKGMLGRKKEETSGEREERQRDTQKDGIEGVFN